MHTTSSPSLIPYLILLHLFLQIIHLGHKELFRLHDLIDLLQPVDQRLHGIQVLLGRGAHQRVVQRPLTRHQTAVRVVPRLVDGLEILLGGARYRGVVTLDLFGEWGESIQSTDVGVQLCLLGLTNKKT